MIELEKPGHYEAIISHAPKFRKMAGGLVAVVLRTRITAEYLTEAEGAKADGWYRPESEDMSYDGLWFVIGRDDQEAETNIDALVAAIGLDITIPADADQFVPMTDFVGRKLQIATSLQTKNDRKFLRLEKILHLAADPHENGDLSREQLVHTWRYTPKAKYVTRTNPDKD